MLQYKYHCEHRYTTQYLDITVYSTVQWHQSVCAEFRGVNEKIYFEKVS